MKEIPEFLDENIFSVCNSFDIYIKDGYFIDYDQSDHILLITYNDIQYTVKIIEKDNEFYWHLSPYNNSYFLTNFYNPSSFNMVLFAIKENDILYKQK